MTGTEASEGQSGGKAISLSQEGRSTSILSRIDLVAIVITLVGICLLGVAAMVMAVIELAKLISSLWAVPFNRWLILILGMAIVWVTARWKSSRI